MNKGLKYITTIGLTLCSAFCVYRVIDSKTTYEANAVSYTIQDFCDYLEDKREHYPLSDEFIERYGFNWFAVSEDSYMEDYLKAHREYEEVFINQKDKIVIYKKADQ